MVVERKGCRSRQELLRLDEGFVHLLGPNPVVGFLQQWVKRTGEFGDGGSEVRLLLSKAKEGSEFSQCFRNWEIGNGLVEGRVQLGALFVDLVAGEDDRMSCLRLLRVEGDAR